MRSLLALIVLYAVSALGTPSKPSPNCNRDACSAAVHGTKSPTYSSRLEDCSSFLSVTVFPPVSTSTVYVRSTIYTTVYPTSTPAPSSTKKARALVNREPLAFAAADADAAAAAAPAPAPTTTATAQPYTMYPVFLPSYATSACSSYAYSSACSCAGVKATTTTTTTPTVTVTSTRGSTRATVTAGARPSCGSTVSGASGQQCTYKVTCDRRAVGGLQTRNQTGLVSEYQCLRLCEDYTTCLWADYERATGLCEIWYGKSGQLEVAPGWDLLEYTGPAPKCQPPS